MRTIVDKRIINELLPILKDSKMIETDLEFCESIDMHKQNLNDIKNGIRSFTIFNIEKICKIYNINANWLFLLEPNIYRKYVMK